MRRKIIAVITVFCAMSASLLTEAYDCTSRHQTYFPDEDGAIVCVNGTNRYTRALYGGNTLWRLETSDIPVFGAYHKTENRHIAFAVKTGTQTVPLDSVQQCVAKYRGGVREYQLTDPAWRGGSLTMTVVAEHDREGAIWRVQCHNMPKDTEIEAMTCAVRAVRLNRSGDLGVDPDNSFDPDPAKRACEICAIRAGKNNTVYIGYTDRKVTADSQSALKGRFDTALTTQQQIMDRVKISTPDQYINTLSTSLAAAAEGIWDGDTYLHGAIGWRMPLAGWRGAYTGDFTGHHDRARTHFDAYALSQVNDVPPTIPHPSPDSTMHLARAAKEWGTQMYSNGYICRTPRTTDKMHHYDMNLCYVDELLWHLQWTGDTAYARQIWPVIKASVEWEKRNYDPDGDGLYDAYCCIWASDALYYNSAGVTHSSAFNCRANRLAAIIAGIVGDDPAPYAAEACRIQQAMDSVLWMDDRGVWAEHRDASGARALHRHPGLWTVYHAIDSETATPRQAWRATRYIDANIPHIPVVSDRLDAQPLYTLSTTDWLPYAWSINNVAQAEVYHTALAYWQAGRPSEAVRLLRGAVEDGMFLGRSPGNVGQISHYDAARGECYRDFADPVGMLSRALVQGLYGITPRLLERRVDIRPGFPDEWEHASIEHPDIDLEYKKWDTGDDAQSATDHDPVKTIRSYRVKLKGNMAARTDSLTLIVPCADRAPLVMVDETAIDPARYEIRDAGTPYATLRVSVPVAASDIAIKVGTHDANTASVAVDEAVRYADIPAVPATTAIHGDEYVPVDMSASRNANVTDIFRNRYLSPRSPYTTLQLPEQGIGEWCHPNDTAYIDDSGLRAAAGTFALPDGLTFETPAAGHNVAYVSLYDNYPDSVTIPLQGKSRALAMMMAGSTNHMQCYTVNAVVEVGYDDGTSVTYDLVPPYNWAPIEQDYYTDGKAFDIPVERPVRVLLRDGLATANPGALLRLGGPADRRIPGGAAIVLYFPLDESKTLRSVTVKAIANEVVVGVMSATYIK